MALKKQISKSMDTSYQGKTHMTPDTSKLVWRIVDDLKKTGLQIFSQNREGNATAQAVPDLRARGAKQLESASLTTFNKKIRNWIDGTVTDEVLEVDTIPSPAFENVTDVDVE